MKRRTHESDPGFHAGQPYDLGIVFSVGKHFRDEESCDGLSFVGKYIEYPFESVVGIDRGIFPVRRLRNEIGQHHAW